MTLLTGSFVVELFTRGAIEVGLTVLLDGRGDGEGFLFLFVFVANGSVMVTIMGK